MLFFCLGLSQIEQMAKFVTPNLYARKSHLTNFPTGIYLFKVSARNTKAGCEICSKLTIKTTERRH